MEGILSNVIQILLSMNDLLLYFCLFISAIIENLFPPIPGDTITAFGAFLVGSGRLNYFWVYFFTTTGSVVGFMALFLLGKYSGRKFFQEKNFKNFSIDKIERTEVWIHKYGYWVVLANRFLPGIRSVISIVSGISRLNTTRVFFLSLISASIWNLICIHTGYLLGNNWDFVKEKFSEILKSYNISVGIVLVVVIAILLIKKYRKRSKARLDI